MPFDERSYVLPNERGRVHRPDGEPLPGVYAVGWIKRGPTGILGTNKRDAEETVRCLLEDLRAGGLAPSPHPGGEGIDALLAERRPDLVTVEGWRAIAAHELERGRAERAPAGQAGVPGRTGRRGRCGRPTLTIPVRGRATTFRARFPLR